MSPIPLRDAVEQHVGARRLDDAQFEALQSLARPPRRSRRRFVAMALAAAAAVTLGTFALTHEAEPMARRIAAEVARNHQKLKPLEVTAAGVDALRPFFASLDFALIDSPRMVAGGWQLEGARHCSVGGLAAAQLRLRRTDDERIRSVYMAPYEAGVLGPLPRVDAGEAPLALHARGMAVEIWVERDVVLVSVSPP